MHAQYCIVRQNRKADVSLFVIFLKVKKARFQMKRAFFAIVDIFDVYQLLRHQAFTFWLDIKLQDGPTCRCLGSQVLMVGWGGVRGGRIRACCAGHNGYCRADGDQGARAQAGDGAGSSGASASGASGASTSSWGRCCWNRCSTNWCRRLSHGLCGSEAQDCRSDQNFLHGISF
jgi:hypothetical protein